MSTNILQTYFCRLYFSVFFCLIALLLSEFFLLWRHSLRCFDTIVLYFLSNFCCIEHSVLCCSALSFSVFSIVLFFWKDASSWTSLLSALELTNENCTETSFKSKCCVFLQRKRRRLNYRCSNRHKWRAQQNTLSARTWFPHSLYHSNQRRECPRRALQGKAVTHVWLPDFALLQYSTVQWVFLERRNIYDGWVQRRLGEVTLRPKSQRQLWLVRFSVLIWRWPNCHLDERSSVKRSTLMVQLRWKPACRCWSDGGLKFISTVQILPRMLLSPGLLIIFIHQNTW